MPIYHLYVPFYHPFYLHFIRIISLSRLIPFQNIIAYFPTVFFYNQDVLMDSQSQNTGKDFGTHQIVFRKRVPSSYACSVISSYPKRERRRTERYVGRIRPPALPVHHYISLLLFITLRGVQASKKRQMTF